MERHARLCTIFGGSGFVGRYVARRLAKRGWRVRVAVRRPNEALFVRTYGNVGQVEPVFANIRDDASVRAALMGADAAVNCVGILAPDGRNTFGAVQAAGAERVARLCAEAGIARLVQISAIGADADAPAEYSRTKAEGEAAVLRHVPGATILRPSIVFGPEDQFFNRFAGMARTLKVVPVVGGDTRFQPVYVDDVAACAARAVDGVAAPGVYEIGGPETLTMRALMQRMLRVIRRRALLLPVPFWAATLLGGVADFAQWATLGVFHNGVLTRDQVRNLRRDNVVTGTHPGLEAFDVEPTAMEPVLEDYLWRFRDSGQYAEIKESAAHLKG